MGTCRRRSRKAQPRQNLELSRSHLPSPSRLYPQIPRGLWRANLDSLQIPLRAPVVHYLPFSFHFSGGLGDRRTTFSSVLCRTVPAQGVASLRRTFWLNSLHKQLLSFVDFSCKIAEIFWRTARPEEPAPTLPMGVGEARSTTFQ